MTPAPTPMYPLQMWLCSSCGLAQLAADATVPEEPRGAEPAALVAQAADAVQRVAAAGLLPAGARVAEYGSPHGGSWLGLLADRGLTPVYDSGPADVVLDCFGLMHAADQSAALAERLARVVPGGVLLLQYHSLETIVRCGQWNALRHGHYAYYSTSALTAMLAAQGFSPRTAWHFELYGGTVLLAARRDADWCAGPDGAVRALLASDARAGVLDPALVLGLQVSARAHVKGLHDWLVAERLGRPDHTRIRCRVTRGCAVAPGRSGPLAAACRGRRLRGQAGPADARDEHPCRSPGAACRATARFRAPVPGRSAARGPNGFP